MHMEIKDTQLFEKNRSRKEELTLEYIYMEPERKRLHDLWYWLSLGMDMYAVNQVSDNCIFVIRWWPLFL